MENGQHLSHTYHDILLFSYGINTHLLLFFPMLFPIMDRGQSGTDRFPLFPSYIYAQLMAEVKEKKCRYWFTNEETLQIQQANAQYQQEQDIESMLEACFRLPEEGEEPKVLSAKSIMDVLEKQFPLLKRSHATTIHVGMKLKTQGYKNVKHHGASCYQVIPLVAA